MLPLKQQLSDSFLPGKRKLIKLGNRSSSETKSPQITKSEGNQRRDLSEKNKQEVKQSDENNQNGQKQIYKSVKEFQIRNTTKKPQINQLKNESNFDIKLPDLKKYTLRPPKPPSAIQQSNQVPLKMNLKSQSQSLDKSQKKASPLKVSTPPEVRKKQSELLLTFASLSKAGFDGHQMKQNQDRDYMKCPLEGSNECGVFAVMDGHGQEGDKVSNFIVERLTQLFNSGKPIKTLDYYQVFNYLHKEIIEHSTISTQFSGSTFTLVVIIDRQVICSWVGDSRAVLCRRNRAKHYPQSLDISRDHKPDLEVEKSRIEQEGGVVDSYHSPSGLPLGPQRVWMKGAAYPGLAMSRSLGDQVAHMVGVWHYPDITTLDITKDDLYLIIASDGIWEFISSQQAVDIVYPFYIKNDQKGACNKLYEEAFKLWKQNNDGVDDITSIVIFLNQNEVEE